MSGEQRALTEQRYQRLKAAFDELVATGAPFTVTDLAHLTGFKAVHSMLRRCPWWSPELARRSREETYRRIHAQAQRTGYPGVQAMRVQTRAISAARAAKLRHAYETLASTRALVPVTVADLAQVTGLRPETIGKLLKTAAWWSPALASAARDEAARRRRAGASAPAVPRPSPGSFAIRPAPATRLQVSEIEAIQGRLASGETPTAIARLTGRHKNTILRIKCGKPRKWSARQATSASVIQVALTEEGRAARIAVSLAVWDRMGRPELVQLVRTAFRQSLLLMPATSSAGSIVRLSDADDAHPFIVLGNDDLHALGLFPGTFACAPSRTRKIFYVSDYPDDLDTPLLTVIEACQFLGVTKARLYQLIEAGRLQPHFCAERRHLVILQSAVEAYHAGGAQRGWPRKDEFP